ncbi:MAG: hypothetical protein ACKO7W_03405 [Elainella sp.]
MPTTVFIQEPVEELLLEGIASGELTDMTQSDWDDLRQVVQTVRQGAMLRSGVWGKEKKGRILLDRKQNNQTRIHHETRQS